MDLNNNISSGVLESFVLGTASPEEIKQVNELCAKYPEILEEIHAIENSLIAYAEANAPKISDSHKEQVFAKLEKKTPESLKTEKNIRIIKHRGFIDNYYKIAIAASIALLIISSVFNLFFYSNLKNTQSELATLNKEKTDYVNQLNEQKISLKNAENDLAFLSNPEIKVIKLNSTETGKQVSALIYWNQTTHQTYINSILLPEPPEGKQYQLWALVNGKPIDAGVFDITTDTVTLQKMKAITGAQTFAVTLEVKGGSPSPNLSALFLLGNV